MNYRKYIVDGQGLNSLINALCSSMSLEQTKPNMVKVADNCAIMTQYNKNLEGMNMNIKPLKASDIVDPFPIIAEEMKTQLDDIVAEQIEKVIKLDKTLRNVGAGSGD